MVQEIKSDEAALQRRMRVSAKRTREILGLSEEEIERLVTRGELRRQSDGSFDARDIAAWVRWHLRVVDPNGPLYEFLENRPVEDRKRLAEAAARPVDWRTGNPTRSTR